MCARVGALSEKGAETLGTTPVPHAALQAPVVLKRCLDGRGAAGGALALVYTQLPFPYVHLLSMLVQVRSWCTRHAHSRACTCTHANVKRVAATTRMLVHNTLVGSWVHRWRA